MRSENPIRAAKISYIVTSVAFCVLGILLIVLRNWSVSFIGVVTGIMLIAFGIVKLLGYFSKDLYRLAFQFDLAFGILLIALGGIILAKPERAMSFVCLMLGVAILADGLFKLQTAVDAKEFGLRSWWAILALAVLAGLIGAVLALHPTESAVVMTLLAGASMIVEGVLNLCVALFAVKVVHNQQPDSPRRWLDV